MNSPRDNISGFWVGRYVYDGMAGEAVQFLCNVTDDSGALSGTISEPNSIGGSSRELNAIVSGSRTGSDVSFAKTYDGASDAAHRVDYAGVLNDKGNVIAGRWSIGDYGGDFSMKRELLDESDVEAEVAEELLL